MPIVFLDRLSRFTSQKRIVMSFAADTSSSPEDEKDKAVTVALWPSSCCRISRSVTFQRFILVSLTEAATSPDGETAIPAAEP
ncbi:hypothetical protein N7467_008969 [Penicillium canescens]|nr:hypothetical protein N7467_008969 [Penicillium canescens]